MQINLHNRQNEVLQAVYSGKNEVLFGGAAGGGKSYLLRALACIFAVQCPGISIYLFRRKIKDLKATHLRGAMSFPILLKDFIRDGLANINKANNIIEFKNNAVITLAHINYENDLNDYLSAEVHIALFDEATTFTPTMLRFIRSRVRLGSLDIPEALKGILPFIVYATNPRGPSHHYFKSGWVDAAEPMTKFTATLSDGGMERIFIPAFLQDNPSIIKNDPQYAERLHGLGDDDIVQAYLKGDWSVVEGAALPKFNRQVHVKQQQIIPLNWVKKRGYDYGFSAPYSVLFYATATGETDKEVGDEDYFNPVKGSIVIIDEIYGDNGDEVGLKEEAGKTSTKIEMKELENDWYVRPGPADNAIFSKEQGPSIASLMKVEWVKSDKTPGSRINGLALCRQMLLNATVFPQEKPGLYIFNNCVRLIRHLTNLQLDGEDIDSHSQPDHDWDVLRYIILDVSKEIRLIKVVGA